MDRIGAERTGSDRLHNFNWIGTQGSGEDRLGKERSRQAGLGLERRGKDWTEKEKVTLKARFNYLVFNLLGGNKMTKTASTQGLHKAMEQKQATPANTTANPYRKAEAYLRAMAPAIAEALPKSKGMDAERLSRITLTTLRSNPKLLECSIESLLGAVLQSAQLGLEPSLLGQCYFIPYKGTVSFQIGFKGYLSLLSRSGEVTNVVAQEVRKGDTFHYEFGRNETLKHIPAPEHQRGEVEYYYAYANMKNGGFAFQVMHISEVEKIRDEHSISYRFDKGGSIWTKHFQAMAYKTVIKKLIKYMPISIETAEAISQDETIRKDITAESIFIKPQQEPEPEPMIIESGEAGESNEFAN